MARGELLLKKSDISVIFIYNNIFIYNAKFSSLS